VATHAPSRAIPSAIAARAIQRLVDQRMRAQVN